MSLLAPAFLAGLALLAVPILIHLTQRQKANVQPFPSLMFLERVPFRSTDRRRIRDPLLFALRCIALIALALAFARPALQSPAAGAASEERQDVVIALDVSYSMAYEDRWERALDEARGVLSGLAEGDRAALITFDETASGEVELTGDLASVGAALDALRPGARTTRFDPAIQLAGRLLADSDRARREVRLITDFQRTGWTEGGRARLPAGVALMPHDLSDPEAANLAVAGIEFDTDAESGRARAVASVVNFGSEAQAVDVSLVVGGRSVGTRTADVPVRGATRVSFTDIAIPATRSRGEVRLAGDRLPVDDVFRFVIAPDETIEVLLLESSRGRADRSLFLERALSVGRAPPIRVVRRRADGFDPAWLESARVVVLSDANLPGGAAGALAGWVEAGGGLIVLAGGRTDASAWSPVASALLGGTLGGVADRTGAGGVRLAWLDYDHPVFELFATPRSGDFSEARFFRFHSFEPDSTGQVLARLEDGAPALVERRLGEGRALLWTSTLDRLWNDLALQPVFLPFVHRLARHAGQFREPERWFPVGRVVDVATLTTEEALPAGSEWVMVAPDGERRTFRAGPDPVLTELDAAGFYEIRPLGADAATRTWAVNAPLEEADLVAVAPETVTGAAAGSNPTDQASLAGVINEEGTEAPRTELWWPLLLLALGFLLVEAVVADRRVRPQAPSSARRERTG